MHGFSRECDGSFGQSLKLTGQSHPAMVQQLKKDLQTINLHFHSLN